MALIQKNLFNSPYSGVFCATNDNLTLIPPGIPEDDMEAISEALSTKFEVITIGGSSVLGTLLAMNNHGILVSNLVSSLEVDKLEKISAAVLLSKTMDSRHSARASAETKFFRLALNKTPLPRALVNMS